jgi:hypothetical protein
MVATITLLKTASDWNNYGVQCINYGDLSGALSHFRKALAVSVVAAKSLEQVADATTTSIEHAVHNSDSKTRIRPLTLLQSTDICGNEANDHGQDYFSRPSKRIKTDTISPEALSSCCPSTSHSSPAEVASSSNEDAEEDEGTLFHQGIIMAPSPSDELSISSSKLTRFSSIQNQSITSAIITFNIGLVYHLLGRRGFGSLTHLQTAVSMYQDCRDLLSASCAFCSTGNSTLDLLAMALFYNMAHIHHNDLMDFPLAKDYSEQLVRFASCIVTSRYQNHNQVMLIKHAMGDFLCNVMTIRNATQVAAAA